MKLLKKKEKYKRCPKSCPQFKLNLKKNTPGKTRQIIQSKECETGTPVEV